MTRRIPTLLMLLILCTIVAGIGAKEAPAREGEEMQLTPEQAGWMLETFRLDSERRLPMGMNDQAQPRDRNRPTW